MQTWQWVVIGAILAGALVFTLVWWKVADVWADSEHKRFKAKGPGGTIERIVIRKPGPADQGPQGGGHAG